MKIALEAGKINNANLSAEVGLFAQSKLSNSIAKNDRPPEAYICPITQEIMKEAVLCTLDGYTYERSAITVWLNQHRTSPMTREALQPDQTVENVLKVNRAIVTAIEEYNEKYTSTYSVAL